MVRFVGLQAKPTYKSVRRQVAPNKITVSAAARSLSFKRLALIKIQQALERFFGLAVIQLW